MDESRYHNSNELVAIEFHGDKIVTFKHNGEPHVAMRRVVENLGLDWASQTTKLSKSKEKFSCCDIATTAVDGKKYQMLTMPVAKLPLWLATINPNKIPDPEKRQKIELYQAESAIALHDYWTKGVAVRGDMDGVVTNLDPAVMKAMGGMFKGILGKAISELRGEFANGAMMGNYVSVSPGMTAGEVIEAAGVTERKGLRGLPRRVSDKLRRFHAEKAIPVKMGKLGPSTAYMFDCSTVHEWLRSGGKQFIHREVEERRGQRTLKLVMQ